MLKNNSLLRFIQKTLSFITFLIVINSCVLFEKTEDCLYQRISAPYKNVDLIVCNDGKRLDTHTYSATACDKNGGIDGVYHCEPRQCKALLRILTNLQHLLIVVGQLCVSLVKRVLKNEKIIISQTSEYCYFSNLTLTLAEIVPVVQKQLVPIK